MSTAEALAVVREALDTYVADVVPDEGFCDPWYAALALIEERLGELEALPERDKWWEQETAWKARAEKAEAERDELKQRATENWDSYENANRRIEELETALNLLRELLTFLSSRRALGGGE